MRYILIYSLRGDVSTARTQVRLSSAGKTTVSLQKISEERGINKE